METQVGAPSKVTLLDAIKARYPGALVFDIETDGLLPWQTQEKPVTRFVGGVVKDLDGNLVYSGSSENNFELALKNADCLIGHNAVSYDIPCLAYLDIAVPNVPVLDTMLLASLANLDLKNKEFDLLRKGRLRMPPVFIGSHKLAAWGHRIGLLKGTSGTEDWSVAEWNEEMEAYCQRDVDVCLGILGHLSPLPWNVIEVEHEFARNMATQQKHGVVFDSKAAGSLALVLEKALTEAAETLRSFYPPWKKFVRHGFRMYTDESGKRRRSATKEDIYEDVVFNPGSGDHIAYVLQHFEGWKPTEKTPTGKPKVDESTIGDLKYKSIPALLRYMLLKKRLGQLRDGEQNLIAACGSDNRIHGTVKTLGTVSTRCSHASPNLAQVPANDSEFGEEFRDLFKPDPGWALVGCDAAALELRCLSHYLALWDGGAYGKIVCEGKSEDGTDVHTVNQKAAKLPTRNDAKTFIYALIYGAGDAKIGSIAGKGAKYGRRLKETFIANIKGFKQLLDGISAAAHRGYLIGLDGRQLPVRSAHSALNLLLQGCGAIIMKYAQVGLQRKLEEEKVPHKFILNIHDEFQITCPKDVAEYVGKAAVQAIKDAAVLLKFRVPMDGAYKIGTSWKETH